MVALFDGFVVNRIPIRFHHWWRAVLPIDIAYPAWTIIHSVLDVGNPNESDNDPTTNDDALYSAVDWKDEAVQTGIFIAINILVIGPIIQLILFVLSLYSPCCRVSRRYLEGENDKESRGAIHDDEEFAVAY